MIGMSSGGGGDSNFEFKMISFALILMVLTPLAFVMYLPAQVEEDTTWSEEVTSIEETYYAHTGTSSNPSMNIWTLKGIYTPYSGTKYGYTEDGWIYGSQIGTNAPSQYTDSPKFSGNLIVAQANDNGLFYYCSHPDNMTGIVDAQYTAHEDGTYTIDSHEGATVYSNVVFDASHTSNVFFTPSSKAEQGGHYYYAFTGYRYVFAPLSDYFTDVGGNTVRVTSNNTSLSLIWYVYAAGTSGIAGQLAISGSDTGISYLSAEDILRNYNSTNYSSTYDMTFNSVKMHLAIRIDPSRLASGMSIEDCYNNGFWSVLVYSDAIAESLTSNTYEFSVDNLLDTLISIFTFNLAEKYDIDGWMGTVVSLLVTMPFYVALIVIALSHSYVWILLALVAAVQSLLSMGHWFDFLG